ncbi:hypothetical protein VNI00_017829 [Paramarasmius palmivorus]|uniref:Terpene synthase n=1 Tax=Paramarasmius palmivorus TaxID=297713 RepID=A0AAW0B345_9AGAR
MSSTGTGIKFIIPNTLRSWPWPRFINPNYEICKVESSAWCESFNAFSPKAQKAFNKCDFSGWMFLHVQKSQPDHTLLRSFRFIGVRQIKQRYILVLYRESNSLVHAIVNTDGCRIGCDLMNLAFIIDEYSDVVDGNGALVYANIVMDAIRSPQKPRPAGEWVGGEIARQFWENAIRTATPSARRRFVDTFQLYMDAVVDQALDREDHHIDGVKRYFDVRRDTIGAKPAFAINEIHMDLSDNDMEHPIIRTLTWTATDMMIIGNDLCSYNVEQSRGDDRHNLVTIVMKEQQIGLHAALKWIGDLHDSLAEEFLTAYAKLQTAGFSDELASYADDLGNWVRANDKWSFESERYFGKEGVEVEKTRIIELLPKQESGAAGTTGLVPVAQQAKLSDESGTRPKSKGC